MGNFERLMESNRRRLWAVARTYARGADAEDLYQEIALQLWRGYAGFKRECAESTWVYRVALNTAMSWQRKATTQRRKAHVEPIEGELAGGPAGGRDEIAILGEFLACLEETDRALLVLYLEDITYREIGEVMGMTESNVGVRITRLKSAFTERYVGG
ncbi:MAG: sigma-70 family RNA polymerase sigma factor [Acidobacteria bacterium]|nr:sigma-70 family RNA polymerase sigma factor [Acidobacteriota bacterium]